jgi:hypothetical protein
VAEMLLSNELPPDIVLIIENYSSAHTVYIMKTGYILLTRLLRDHESHDIFCGLPAPSPFFLMSFFGLRLCNSFAIKPII